MQRMQGVAGACKPLMDTKQEDEKGEELHARLARLEQELALQRTRRYELELEIELLRRRAVVPTAPNDTKPTLRRLIQRRGSE